jgi:hypothetical protein
LQILIDRHHRKVTAPLRHERDPLSQDGARLAARNVLALPMYAAILDGCHTVERFQERGFACSVRPHQCDELAGWHIEIDAVQDVE